MRRSSRDPLVQQHWVRYRLVIRREAAQHLENQHTQSIPIDTLVISLLLHDFRREVVRCPAERPRHVRAELRESKVRDFDVSVVIQEHVFRLEVSVDDVHVV